MNNREIIELVLKRGWSVFPMTKDKVPMTKHGFLDATRSKSKIDQWLSKWGENMRIGIPCEPNLFFAIDVDEEGVEVWQNWISEYGMPELGPWQHTPHNGFHYLFKLPIGIKIPHVAGQIATGIDLRSNGSITTGGEGSGYVWSKNGLGLEDPLTDAPGWFLKFVQEYNEIKEKRLAEFHNSGDVEIDPDGAGEYWLKKALSLAVQGTRHETGFMLACQLRDSRVPQSQAEAIMRQYAAGVPKGSDPFPVKDVLCSLRDAYSAAPRQPAHLPSSKRPVIPAPKGLDVRKEEPKSSVLPSGAGDCLSDTNVIPVALMLTEKEVSQVNNIAVKLKLPRHQVLSLAVRKYLTENNGVN